MKIGINWSDPADLELVLELLSNGTADFCEILIDNFLHVEPARLAKAFEGREVGFHIMNSRFLERDTTELRALAARIRAHAAALKPLYVSDHLGVFCHEGRRLPFLMELDYERDARHARDGAARWQELLGETLYVENYPSIFDVGRGQPDFLASLAKEAGARVLFDFSNAVVAEKNCGVPTSAWSRLIASTDRFHAAGYSLSDTTPALVRDSHDGELSPETLAFLKDSLPLIGGDASLSVERDANVERSSWSRDLSAARAAATLGAAA